MVKLEIRTPEGIALHREVAGAGARFAAALIDGVIFALLYGTFAAVLLLATQAGGGSITEFLIGLLIGGAILGYPVLTVISHGTCGGKTPGKHVLGLRVATVDGYPAGWLALTLRALTLPIEVILPLPVPGTLGLALVSLTDRRQRLGDLVAGTLVLSEGSRASDAEPFEAQTWSGLEPKTLPLTPGLTARLDVEDFALLRDLLARKAMDLSQQRVIYVQAARHYAGRLGTGEFEDARVFLKELFLFLREHRSGH